jgi:transketolase
VSDGDLMEGVAAEAASLAGLWGLGKLIWLYDSNHITLDGAAEMTFAEDTAAKFTALGWHVLAVEDGMNVDAVSAAIEAAKAETGRPSLLIIQTIIGFGSPNKANTSDAHGSPLGPDEIRLTKEAYGWPQEDFFVPGEALELFRGALDSGERLRAGWEALFDAYRAAFPDLATAYEQALRGQLPDGWDADIPTFPTDKPIATRTANGTVLNAIARHIPTMIGGDADLAGSTKTLIKGAANTGRGAPAARNVRFGVREHAMGAIVNGLAVHGGIIKPYSATFLTFSDYMRPAIRLGALMGASPVYVFTHDSIGLGEDGPTHQPVEHVMSLRLIPNLYTFRPADANETAGAWKTAMTVTDRPSVLIFTRQDLPVLTVDGSAAPVREGVARGGYVLADCAETPEVLLLSSGSEVHIAHAAYHTLTAEGVRARVVSLPCWELFEAQPEAYRVDVLPPHVTARVAVEAGRSLGWERWVGNTGAVIGLDHFGASAPYKVLYEHFGITPEAVVAAAHRLLGR